MRVAALFQFFKHKANFSNHNLSSFNFRCHCSLVSIEGIKGVQEKKNKKKDPNKAALNFKGAAKKMAKQQGKIQFKHWCGASTAKSSQLRNDMACLGTHTPKLRPKICCTEKRTTLLRCLPCCSNMEEWTNT